MPIIYYSESHNPYQNIATEYSILQSVEEPSLYLWVNYPCAIVGKNQNTYAEINMDYIRQLNILPVRRLTGGGCVYHDLGNLNFSFFNVADTPDYNFLSIIIKALKIFGIDATLSGRNDLCVKDKKIGGTAYLVENGKSLIHGTLMVDVNIDILTKVLQPNNIKYKDRGIKSIRSRVVNLSCYSLSITTASLAEAIIKVFRQEYPDTRINKATIDLKLSKELSKREWIYGDWSNGDVEVNCKTKKGVITAHVNVYNGLIQNVQIFTDSLEIDLSEQLEIYLLNKPFEKIEYFINHYVE